TPISTKTHGHRRSRPSPRPPFALRLVRGVEKIGRGLVEAVDEMAVRVEGGSDGDVTEAALKDLWIDTLGDEHGGVRVAERVEGARLADRLPHRRQPYAPAEVVPS